MNDILEDLLIDSRFREGIAWQRRQYATGDVIIQKGEIGRALFFIEAGVVRVLGDVELDANRHFKPGFCDLKTGDVFGEICLYTSQVQTTSVTALTDCGILALDGPRLAIFLDDHPVQGYLFFRELFQILMQRLLLANNRIENLLGWGMKAHDIDKHLT